VKLPDRYEPIVRRGQDLYAWFRDERPDDPFLMRCLRGLLSVDYRDRVLITAGQAFIAVIPLLILVATTLSSDGASELADRFADQLGLDDQTAAEMSELFVAPPGYEAGVSLVGYAIVLWSVTSLGRTLRRTFERRWHLPAATGFAASRDSLFGVLVLVLMGASIAVIGSVVRDVLAFLPVVLFAQFAVSVACWAACIYLFLARRVELHVLLPGALVGGVAQIAAGWAVGIYLPRLIAHDLARYGTIGFSFSIVSWLIVLAGVIVGVAVVSYELSQERAKRAARKAAAGSRPE
jgi:uncharacterized BrkB/YihY/UPF0761 family membrane protein